MDDCLKEALDIVKAQAGVRIMNEEEILEAVHRLSTSLRRMIESDNAYAASAEHVKQNPKNTIKEKSITCLECGKQFRILTKRHLASHNIEPSAYREKWGFDKNTPLVSKALQRERRKKMQEMQLWEKRRKEPAA